MNDFDEFPSYITSSDDIVGPFINKVMAPDYKNLNLDSVRLKSDGSLVNIEHHSNLNSKILRRDYNYAATLFQNFNKKVYPVIFNTGPVPKKIIEYANETMFYNPEFFNTVRELGMVNLNNLRYKVSNKEKLTQKDALDLIWLIKSGVKMDKQDLLMELTVDIWAKAVSEKWILDSIRKNLLIWAKKYLKDDKKIKIFKEKIRMSKIEIKSFEEQMRIAGIAGELERAEERGYDIGRDKTEKSFVSRLLENYTPQEISDKFDIPVERVLEIQNG